MSQCLVTGGVGFIGSHIVRRLLADGHRVRILDDLSTGRRENIAEIESDVELVIGSICDAELVQRCTAGVEWLFHLAARASVPRSIEQPRDTHNVNITGTFNLLLGARDAGTRRFVYSASSAAYGDAPTLPKHESQTPAPLSPYAVSKLAAEHYCASFAEVYGLETISLRYFNVFGPRQDPNSAYAAVIPAFVSHMLRGQAPIVFGDGEHSRDFCYIDNVIDANLRAAQCEKLHGEVVNIACGERTTLNEIIARINQLLGTNIAAEYRAPRVGDVRHSLADIAAAHKLIGYTPSVMFNEGLERSLAYYKETI
ncbi:MAG: SDR family oxidoreductase [Planctomycetes bacterium]|nr:SDR family oxidoreductase [Planctomycetota bacterium]